MLFLIVDVLGRFVGIAVVGNVIGLPRPSREKNSTGARLIAASEIEGQFYSIESV